MVVSGVWIHSAARLVLHGQLHLVGSRPGDLRSDAQGAVIGDHGRLLVAVLDIDRPPIEVIAIGLEHVELRSVARHRFDRQHNTVFPAFHRQADLAPLSGPELPVHEPPTLW